MKLLSRTVVISVKEKHLIFYLFKKNTVRRGRESEGEGVYKSRGGGGEEGDMLRVGD